VLSPPLILILAVVLAYLAAHVAFDWLAKRFLLVSGAEYLLLGILLGPHVSGVLSAQAMAGFAPFITLALGWIGAIVGTQFYLAALVRIPGLSYRLAFTEALGTAFVVGGLELLLISRLSGEALSLAILPAVALGAIAAVSAPAGIEVVARRIGGRREPILRQIQVATAIDALVGILAMGILFCIFHPANGNTARPITPTEWAVITIAIGVVGGALFHLFLGGETNPDRLFISLAGAIILSSGAAAYLHLSPVLTSMIVGATLINTSRSREAITATLARSEQPFYFVLLVFAGASWQPSVNAWWWELVLVFLVVRVAAKIGSARLGARLNGAIPTLGLDWGRALIGQGGLAIALALDYTRFEGGVLQNAVFTAAIASVLVTDVASARLLHGVMSRLLPGLVARGEAAVAAERSNERNGDRSNEPRSDEAGRGRTADCTTSNDQPPATKAAGDGRTAEHPGEPSRAERH
jgi:Kef-type K+ transport system membrane component KefB